MRMKRIALWLFIAIIMSGIMLGFGFISDMKKAGGLNNMSFGLGTPYDIDLFKDMDLNTAKKIEIHTLSSDTHLKKGNSEKVSASLTGRVFTTDPGAVPTLEVNRSGDILYITEKRTDDKNFSLTTWSFSAHNLKLEITLPDSFKGEVTYNGSSGGFTTSDMSFERLDLNITSGDVHLANLTLKEDLKVSSSSGLIEVRGITAKTAQFKATSGDKVFENLTLEGTMQVDSSSGITKMKDIRCSQITLDSTSGDVIVERIQVSQFQADSSSGRVDVKELDGGARIKATSGDIDVTVSRSQDAYSLSASSGNITLTLPSETGFGLDAKVSSGNIRCAFDLANEEKKENRLAGTWGNGEIPIHADTTSGNITINKR